MVHNEIHAIDLGIIAAYLIAMVVIGVVVVKRYRAPTTTIWADVLSARWC